MSNFHKYQSIWCWFWRNKVYSTKKTLKHPMRNQVNAWVLCEHFSHTGMWEDLYPKKSQRWHKPNPKEERNCTHQKDEVRDKQFPTTFINIQIYNHQVHDLYANQKKSIFFGSLGEIKTFLSMTRPSTSKYVNKLHIYHLKPKFYSKRRET